MIKKLWSFRRSLFVQLFFLSFIIIILLFLQLIIEPYLQKLKDYSNQTITEGILYSEIQVRLISGDSDFDYLEDNDLVKRIKSVNPDFRYYISTKNKEFSFGGKPKNIPHYQGTHYTFNQESNQTICLLSSRGMNVFKEKDGHGVAVYNNCPLYAFYFEIAGINVSVYDETDVFWDVIQGINIASQSEKFIGMFLIIILAILIILNAIKSLRRTIITAQKIDLDSNREHIDEKGLPLEALPMIRAFNNMLSRLEQSYDRNKFFLAAAAHEMRTPLTIMRMKLEENSVYVLKKEMKEQINRMSSLIENLLKLTKYKSNDEMNTQQVELNTLSRRVCASLVPLVLNKSVEIELIASKNNVYINAEEKLLETAISNIIDNALSFSKKGDVITVEVFEEASISITDQGPGMENSVLKFICEPFNKNPPNRDGHGLGLAIVKAIMDLHEGSIQCESKVNIGSSFKLFFNKSFK